MAAHARLKNEFTEDEKYNLLLITIVFSGAVSNAQDFETRGLEFEPQLRYFLLFDSYCAKRALKVSKLHNFGWLVVLGILRHILGNFGRGQLT